MSSVVSWLMDLFGQSLRLALVIIVAAVLNLLLFYAGLFAWDMFKDTDMGGNFSHIHPALYHLLGVVVALTPYWQSSLQLAVAAVASTLGLAALLQIAGLRRLLFDPLSLPLKWLWSIGLTLMLAGPLSRYDGRLDFRTFVFLLLPCMLCVLLPVMRSVSRVLPDIPMLLGGDQR